MIYPPLKRSIDFSFSVLLLVVLSPLMVVIALVLLLFQGRPVLFVQVRPGLNERLFRILKFRTMDTSWQTSAEKRLSGGRTTLIGKVLRELSLDELPQLINILKGDMSFVGPRPLLVDYLPLYSNDQRVRHNVRPGLTGLAQIAGRNEVPWERKLALDAEYALNQSLGMDVRILFKTIVLVFSRRGIGMQSSEPTRRLEASSSSEKRT